MTIKDIRKRMSLRHEKFVAELFGSRINPGSGNQWNKQLDGRSDSQSMFFAFAWDCKATLAASHSVSLATWEKVVEQAGWERPMLPIRFYETSRLDRYTDLAVVRLSDLYEMWVAANAE